MQLGALGAPTGQPQLVELQFGPCSHLRRWVIGNSYVTTKDHNPKTQWLLGALSTRIKAPSATWGESLGPGELMQLNTNHVTIGVFHNLV